MYSCTPEKDIRYIYRGLESLILPMLSYMYPGYHVWPVHWLYWNSRDIVIKRRQCFDKVTSSSDIVSQRIQELLGAFFNIQCGEQEEKNPLLE